MEDRLFPENAAAPDVPADEATKTLTFEAALAQLEELVRKMETGQLPLDKLIVSYEQGARLARLCRSRLDALEQKIKILSENEAESPRWNDFDPGSGR
ncbi:MAG: exodeoxyribonuclease VII small subunit [Victivallaceae bacterium]|nr:exodeoxyribonuclease VII small subunit [Victivallaceae bacterium]